MSLNSHIEWTESTWNPVTGCTQISPGCAHCYAKTFAERFRGVPGHPYEMGFDLTLRPWLIRGARERAVLDADRYCWYDPQHPPTIGLTKPAVDLIRVLSAPRIVQQRNLL